MKASNITLPVILFCLFAISCAQQALAGKNSLDIPFLNAEEEKITLKEFDNKLLILNFWATWCAPCVHEMPALSRLQEDFPEDIKVIAVSEDFKGIKAVKKFYKSKDISNLTPYADIRNKLMGSFGVSGLPTTIFLDSNGKELTRLGGEIDWDSDKIRGFIDSLY